MVYRIASSPIFRSFCQFASHIISIFARRRFMYSGTRPPKPSVVVRSVAHQKHSNQTVRLYDNGDDDDDTTIYTRANQPVVIFRFCLLPQSPIVTRALRPRSNGFFILLQYIWSAHTGCFVIPTTVLQLVRHTFSFLYTNIFPLLQFNCDLNNFFFILVTIQIQWNIWELVMVQRLSHSWLFLWFLFFVFDQNFIWNSIKCLNYFEISYDVWKVFVKREIFQRISIGLDVKWENH